MSKQIFYGKNLNGNPVIAQANLLKDVMRSFGDTPFQVTIERRFKKRSISQNSFYWSNVVSSQIECFKEYWGEVYSPKQIHDWNKATFWADTAIVGDEAISKPASSTKYSTTEWEVRVDQIRTFFLNKFDWVIEYPNKQSEMALKF